MLSIGIRFQLTQFYPTLLGSDLGVLGHLWSQNDVVITSWLRVTATSNCFSHILDIYKEIEHIIMLFIGIL